MLIPSHRHTTADRRLWAELEAADIDYGQSPQFRRKVMAAIDVIRAFLIRPAYCSISGGKDSAVLAHLVSRVDLTVPVRWIATEPLIDPYCRQTIAAIVERCGLTNYLEHTNWCRRDESGWHATGTLESGIKAIERETGLRRYLLGVRADESGARRIRCRRWGVTSIHSCAPLAWWDARDVFAYAAVNHVPLHPTYGMMGGGRWPRERLRVAFLGLTHGRNYGRNEWEREYYGDLLNRLAT